MKRKKIEYIYWFAYYNTDSPSVRYRALYPLETFSKKGIKSTLITPSYKPKKIINFIFAWLSAILFRKRNSIIVIQRVQSNFIYCTLLKILVSIQRKNTIYDIDDADYLIVDPHSIYHFASKCEFISAGSKAIYHHLLPFNKNIIHVTSPVASSYQHKKIKNQKLTIGWIGGYRWGHQKSLEEYFFKAIKNIDFEIKLILIGVDNAEDETHIKQCINNNPKIELYIPKKINWQNEPSIQLIISEFDIGIATLEQSAYHQSKSGIKVKQYLNNGVPVLSTDLPENNNHISNGINGYLCNSAFDFLRRIEEFHQMSDEAYSEYTINALKSVLLFNHEKYLKDFNELINISSE